LRAAKRAGRWHVVGVEPITDAALQARRGSGCEVRCATLDAAAFPPASFDVIAMLGALEHLHDPMATLRIARMLLKRDGVLAAYVPNFHYLAWKDAGLVCYARTGRWSKLHPQEHLFHYTPATIRQILQKCGFDVVRIDVGRPFTSQQPLKRLAKEVAYMATCALKSATGIHLGGLEVVARVSNQSTQAMEPKVGTKAA
jgi:SAM-dependent methyltransferase